MVSNLRKIANWFQHRWLYRFLFRSVTIWDRPYLVYDDGEKIDPRAITFRGVILHDEDRVRKIGDAGGSMHVTLPKKWLKTVSNDGKVRSPLIIHGKMFDGEGNALTEIHDFIVISNPNVEVKNI